MPDIHTLSPEQIAQLPAARDAITKAFKDAIDLMAKLGATSSEHTAGMPQLQPPYADTEDAGAQQVAIPLALNKTEGVIFTFYLPKSEALAFAADILRALQEWS